MEDNKQNKRENGGKKTVRIFAFNSPSRQCLAQILFKCSEFRPAELFVFKALLILIAYIASFEGKYSGQPRPQGILAFQYGGGRREDPGTQRKSRD